MSDESFDLYSAELAEAGYEGLSNGALVTLLGRSLEGDKEAWHSLWQHGLRMVLKIVNKMTYTGALYNLSRDEAISIGNAAIGEALLNWIPKKGSYSTWVWVWIRQSILNADRSPDAWHASLSDVFDVEGSISDPDTEIENEQLRRAVQALPLQEHTVITQYYFHGYSQKDISQIHGISKQRVNQLIRNGIDKLREALDGDEDFSLEEW